VLLLAALSQGTTAVHDLLDSDDTRVMLDALQKLGCTLRQDEQEGGRVLHITGLGCTAQQRGALAAGADLFLGNAGTAMRPLTAALALLGGDFHLHGIARMHERPIGDLVDALQQLGCAIHYTGAKGYPPLQISGKGSGQGQLKLDAPIKVRGDVSSQFLTALLLALPVAAAQSAITIEVVGELISKPYIDITLKLLAQFGIAVQRQGWQRFTIPQGARYQSPGKVFVEADASSASYFIAAGALAADSAAPLRIEGVGAASIQGDIRFIEAARAMGAKVESGDNHLLVSRGAWPLKAISLDCNHIPDAAMTLAIMALYAEGTSTLTNIASWRVKETDRIAAMQAELSKLGAVVEAGADFIRINPPANAAAWQRASIHTYDDHRMAMCFALAALHSPVGGIRIEDPKCVGKTFPDFFEALFSVAQARPQDIPVICIDGPTASGKGTLAGLLAQRLGFHYLDSGALYRVLALAAQRAGVAWSNEAALADLARSLPVAFAGEEILLGGQEVGLGIRSEEMGQGASQVSVHPAVRAALLDLQRNFHRLPGLVADGRDMGTVVFPDSGVKVFLTASAEQRAARRVAQIQSRGGQADEDTVLADLQARDARDRERSAAPLVAAADARELDNSHLGIEDSIARVLGWYSAA
jgi:3-phosphoshikimate 1-carboxyvinyltransferase